MMSHLKYDKLSDALQRQIITDRENRTQPDFGARDEDVIRRNMERDRQNLWRPSYIRDIEKIMHCPFYNRYADKTQVFSFYRNDDITRRALHVQLVSRIARNIGRVLHLNLDLIEAIALGHDIGHTPFGHAGERFLSELLETETGRFFNHNVHSVRVLDKLFSRNISLQTLDGILCHNGEFEQKEYRPRALANFGEFDRRVEECYTDKKAVDLLVPATLEGCVVRVCDMIAYLGKDRQDARKAKIITNRPGVFSESEIGVENATIINNMIVNIIENSYGKDYILLGDAYYKALCTAKRENNEQIYKNNKVFRDYEENIRPMFHEVYYHLLSDLKAHDERSVIYRHHIAYLKESRKHYVGNADYYREEEPNQIVVDYIASMTDDYFIELHEYLEPKSKYHVTYHGYFDDKEYDSNDC